MKSHFDTCSVVKIVVDDDVASSVVVPLVVVDVVFDIVLVNSVELPSCVVSVFVVAALVSNIAAVVVVDIWLLVAKKVVRTGMVTMVTPAKT